MLRTILINVSIFIGVTTLTWTAAYLNGNERLASYASNLMLYGFPYAIVWGLIHHYIKQYRQRDDND